MAQGKVVDVKLPQLWFSKPWFPERSRYLIHFLPPSAFYSSSCLRSLGSLIRNSGLRIGRRAEAKTDVQCTQVPTSSTAWRPQQAALNKGHVTPKESFHSPSGTASSYSWLTPFGVAAMPSSFELWFCQDVPLDRIFEVRQNLITRALTYAIFVALTIFFNSTGYKLNWFLHHWCNLCFV